MTKRAYCISTVAVGSEPYVIAKFEFIAKRVVEIWFIYNVAFYFTFISFVNHEVFSRNPVSKPVY
jgi:hypothetical protein